MLAVAVVARSGSADHLAAERPPAQLIDAPPSRNLFADLGGVLVVTFAVGFEQRRLYGRWMQS
jgi:hypothetical protein